MSVIRSIAFLIGTGFTVLTPYPVAGCGVDIFCAVSRSLASGVGEGVKPLVANVMEREAPDLILKLQGAVDHNILTSEQAGDRLINLSRDILSKVLADASLRGERLVQATHDSIMQAEKALFEELNSLVEHSFAQLHCEALSTNILIDNQRDQFMSSIKDILPRWWVGRSRIEGLCRQDWGIPQELSIQNLEVPSLYKLWRCVRLAHADVRSSQSILVAYQDAEFRGKEAICALQNASKSGVDVITDMWNDDGVSAAAWQRAISEN